MILAAELSAAFVAGMCCVIVAAALLGPRLTRWYFRKKIGGMIDLTKK